MTSTIRTLSQYGRRQKLILEEGRPCVIIMNIKYFLAIGRGKLGSLRTGWAALFPTVSGLCPSGWYCFEKSSCVLVTFRHLSLWNLNVKHLPPTPGVSYANNGFQFHSASWPSLAFCSFPILSSTYDVPKTKALSFPTHRLPELVRVLQNFCKHL